MASLITYGWSQQRKGHKQPVNPGPVDYWILQDPLRTNMRNSHVTPAPKTKDKRLEVCCTNTNVQVVGQMMESLILILKLIHGKIRQETSISGQ